jgi:hypothetical protein
VRIGKGGGRDTYGCGSDESSRWVGDTSAGEGTGIARITDA